MDFEEQGFPNCDLGSPTMCLDNKAPCSHQFKKCWLQAALSEVRRIPTF